ncbi:MULTISPECIES: trypsin-like peptidase domain-containing protein [unclassified Frigoribacterium]|uniref:S1C family serine protease n=1 Tax=unclassified Frigoribacterium TaxID=2627005 RepID=UPI000F4965A8|nr:MULTISPECIES: trypsin-like peptidase domain-containing protein [unclassified Frigoribacterium]ROP77518.1 S1-C subfamily serine protease [Frigoribacterium sp. PhB107]TDT65370.1 S1-C subfamily serine protease [Frigoribacterium sp. PhB116]
MNDRESDADRTADQPTPATTPTPTPSPTPSATPTPSSTDRDPAEARTLPHVTGSSDARFVSAAAEDPAATQGGTAASAPSLPSAFGPRPPRRRRPARWALVTGAAAVLVLGVGGASVGAWSLGHSVGLAAAEARQQTYQLSPQQLPSQGSPFGSSDGSSSGGQLLPGQAQGGTGSTGGTGASESSATAATADETKGVVTIVSTLDYDSSHESAGTGMVMTADGLVLTNNHVVQGATSIEVTDETTGQAYTAKVVGTDATNDVAVLQLEDASGLTPVDFDASGDVATGDAVHSTGNAGGTGDLVTAEGTVLATDQAISVASETGSGTESLSGLIELQSDVVSGDSGGPLRDADGEVVGIVTAASSGAAPITGYAIPISHALSIAKQIVAGQGSSTIQIGLPAFLGAQISSTATGTGAGVAIAGTVEGSAAESAGLVAGDTVTALDGTAVADASALTAAVQAHDAGDQVQLTWTDATGTSHTATVTLGEGPAA